MAATNESQPLLRGFRLSRPFIYTVVNLAVFTDAYLYGLIIPVLPFALIERVNIPASEVQRWIGILLAAYGAGLIIGSPIAGWIADRGSSRRGPYLWGLIALAISTLALTFGQTKEILFVGRLVQGGSSAIVFTVGTAILADTVGQDGVGPAMGFVTLSMALGVVLGPMIGGILYHELGYLAVFMSAYVLVGLDFLLRVLMITGQDGAPETNDVGIANGSYGTMSHDDGKLKKQQNIADSRPTSPLLSRSSSTSSTSSLPKIKTLSPPQLSLILRHPLLVLLTSPRMLVAILGDFMQSLIVTGLETVLPLRIKIIFHYNSTQVALVFLALSLPHFAGPAVGHLSDRVGAKICVCLGFLCTAPLIILFRLVDHYESSQVALLCVLLLGIGLSVNFILTPVWSEAMYVVDDKAARHPGVFGEKGAYAQAFGLMNVAYSAGSLVGPLVGGLLVERVGWNNLTLATGVLCGVCVIPCFLLTGGRRSVKGDLGEEERGGEEVFTNHDHTSS